MMTDLVRKSSYDGKFAGLYDLERTLGRGHFAIVKLAKHVFTGLYGIYVYKYHLDY